MKFLLYLAILPSIIIGYLIYRLDKVEKEPISKLIQALLLGVVSAILTVIVSYLLGIVKIHVDDIQSLPRLFFYSLIGIALIEEGCKWLCTYLLLHKNKDYNYLFDGVVYTVFVSLGFATIENIIYSVVGGLQAVLIRGVFTVPAHAFFAVFMGYYLSFAKRSKLQENKKKYLTFLMLSLLIPTLLHGFFDFLLLSQEIIFLIAFFIFIIFLYTVSILRIKMLSKTDTPFLTKTYCSKCGSKLSGNVCPNCKESVEEEVESI